jgi:hypothetical protein
MSTHPVRLITGFDPVKISTNLIRFMEGSVSEFYGTERFDSVAPLDVDLSTTGLNALDTGTLVDGDGVYFYLVSNGSGSFGILASKQVIAGSVTYPSGYTFQRKLNFGFIYKSVWDGIPYFHATGFSSPFVRLTSAESTGTWCALSAGIATSWTNVDLSDWVPDNARVALIQCEVRYSGLGGDASSYIRSDSSVGQNTGLLVGTVGPANTRNACSQIIRVTSARKFQYQNNAASAKLYVYVLGYYMSDPV